MSKKWLSIFCCLLLIITLTACNTQLESAALEENSTSESNIADDDQTPQSLKQYRKYVDPFAYQIGRESWDDAEKVDPDAFVVYYIYMGATDEVEFSSDWPKDQEYNNPLIPEDVLEQFVQKHFDVTAEHIRKSQYYDADKHAYWSGGIGTTVDLYTVGAEQTDDSLTIRYIGHIDSTDYLATWDGNIILRLEEDGNYKYVSYKLNNYHEEVS